MGVETAMGDLKNLSVEGTVILVTGGTSGIGSSNVDLVLREPPSYSLVVTKPLVMRSSRISEMRA